MVISFYPASAGFFCNRWESVLIVTESWDKDKPADLIYEIRRKSLILIAI